MSRITQIRENLGMEITECFERSNEGGGGFPTRQTLKQAEESYPKVHNLTVIKLAKGMGMSHVELLIKELELKYSQ